LIHTLSGRSTRAMGRGSRGRGVKQANHLDLSMTGRAEPLTLQVENEGSVALRNGGSGLVGANVGSEVLESMDVNRGS
jgi:hypothetical protein